MMVNPVAPVSAVKTAETRRAITASPPGSQPRIALEKRTRRWGALLAARIYPASAKRGRAGREGVWASLYNSMMRAEESIPSE